MTKRIAIGINQPNLRLRIHRISYTLSILWRHNPFLSKRIDNVLKRRRRRRNRRIGYLSLFHPGGRRCKPRHDLFVKDSDENCKYENDAANDIVPYDHPLAHHRENIFGNIQSHSLLSQNLQFDNVLQSKKLSLSSSASSLGVGLGVLENCRVLSGLLNVVEESLTGGYGCAPNLGNEEAIADRSGWLGRVVRR